MSAAEHANFIAAKVIAYATAYLDGRNDLADLARNAHSISIELDVCSDDPDARPILDAARMLRNAMTGTAGAIGEARLDRWQHLMGVLVEMIRHESHELRRSGAQRS
jgi:hypothetical protein